MSEYNKRRNTARIQLQDLEDRRMLAVFGTPWPEPRDLNVSFPNDGVAIGGYENVVGETLDQAASRQDWQELVLRSYQTWTEHADINVGLRNDHDVSFGVPGKMVGDPRFGEFRVGAFPQQGLLANSIPFQASAGTYSGDLILNSNESLTYHNWDNDLGPDPASLGEDDRDLFSLFLHEVGNTLGVEDNSMEWTVMFRQYTSPKGLLTQEDIDAIQAIYGARTDPFETVDNGQIASATLIPTPAGFDSSAEVIRTRGSLLSGTDVDHFKVVPIAGQDSAIVRVRAQGVSLLKSNLEIIDSAGQVVAQTSSGSVFENDHEIQINNLTSLGEFYIRVSAEDPADHYSFGDFILEVDYRSDVVRANDPIQGSYDSGVDSLFTNFALNDTETGENEDRFNSTVINEIDPLASAKRYEVEASVSSAADVDVFQITAPTVVQGRLVVHVSGVGAARPDVRAIVVDSNGQSVGTSAKLSDDGTFTMEVTQPVAGEDYFIRVSVDSNSAVSVGNYVAVAEFESPTGSMEQLFSRTAEEDETDKYIRWTAAKTKLYRFDLSVAGGTADQSVRLTIYDAHTREMKAVVTSQSDLTRTTLAWLQQGDYILHFAILSPPGQSVVGLTYSVEVEGLSDDQDEDDYDPDVEPDYELYTYTYTEPTYEYTYYYEEQYYEWDSYYSGP